LQKECLSIVVKRLLIIGNPFQLMQALFFQERLFKDKDVTDILIFRSVIGHEMFTERLKELHLFRKVMLINENAKKGKRFKKIFELLLVSCGHAERMSYIVDSELINSDYDEVWYYNYCLWYYGIYDLINSKENRQVKFVAFMESIFTYTYLRNGEMSPPISLREKIIRIGRSLCGKWILYPYSENVYIQFPEMANSYSERIIHTLPILTSKDRCFYNNVKHVFSVPVFRGLPKYIFMASSLEFDGFGNGETDLIIQIADIVGKENLIVKLHPRDNRCLLEKAGISIMDSSRVCWEAIQLGNDFSQNVFLTVASASIVNTILFSGEDLEAYYLFPLIIEMSDVFRTYCLDSVENTINMAHHYGKAKNTKVVKSMDELYGYLQIH